MADLLVKLSELLFLVIIEGEVTLKGFGPVDFTILVVYSAGFFCVFALVLQSLTEMAIPVVHYLVIRTPWMLSSNERPPVPQGTMKPDDKVVFISCDVTSSLDIGPKVVHPS